MSLAESSAEQVATQFLLPKWSQLLEAESERFKGLDAVCRIRLDGQSHKVWYLQCGDFCRLSQEAARTGAAYFYMDVSSEDFVAIAKGRVSLQQAFIQRKLKLSGDTFAALQLNQVLLWLINESKE